MHVYRGLANYVVYGQHEKCLFTEYCSSCMIAMKIPLTTNCQYGGSGKVSCFGLSAAAVLQ